MDEFELIERCLRERTTRRAGTVLGIGDDAALLDTGGRPLVRARATTAFSVHDDAAGTARYAFGAAFIRLAAQAVRPRWATLALTLDVGDPDWTESFAATIASVCDACEVELVGGDTTRGPGRATVFALGTATTLPRRTMPRPPSRGVTARLPLAVSTAPAPAIAALVSVCTDLAERDAGIRCDYRTAPSDDRAALGGERPGSSNDRPGTSDARRSGDLELVVRTDAAGMDALRAVAGRLGLEARGLDPDG